MGVNDGVVQNRDGRGRGQRESRAAGESVWFVLWVSRCHGVMVCERVGRNDASAALREVLRKLRMSDLLVFLTQIA